MSNKKRNNKSKLSLYEGIIIFIFLFLNQKTLISEQQQIFPEPLIKQKFQVLKTQPASIFLFSLNAKVIFFSIMLTQTVLCFVC